MLRIQVLAGLLIWFAFSGTLYAVGGDSQSLEDSLAVRGDLIFFGGFEEQYNNSAWESSWGIPWNNRADENTVISDAFQGGHSLRVGYPQGGVGPGETGTQFPIVFRNMSETPGGYFNSVYLRYYLKFESGFDFQKGGKLPGLMGGGDSWSRSGGNQPDGSNGWTLRFMWRVEGSIVVYAYVPKSANGKWGTESWGQDIDCHFNAIPGTWHCIEQYVNVGTPGHDDGKLKVWIDGEQRLDIADMRFWDVENDDGRVGGIYFSTFHGGNTPDWGPDTTCYVQFDGIVAAEKRVGLYGTNPAQLRLNGIELPTGYTELPYRAELDGVQGGVPPYEWSIINGDLPEGLFLTLDGILSGVPANESVSQLLFSVRDAQGDTAAASANLDIISNEGINLANAMTLSAHSNNFDPDNPVQGMWDGDISGEPAGSPGADNIDSFWVEYDLGKVFPITKIRLFGDAAGSWISKTYSVYLRSDSMHAWRAVVDQADCYGDQWYETDLADSARYIRCSVTGDTVLHRTQIREFEVYETYAPQSHVNHKNHCIHNFQLHPNAPNPFNPSTTLTYTLSESSPVRMSIYSIAGKKVREWYDSRQQPGQYTIDWNGMDSSGLSVASGVYFYQLKTDWGHTVQKMTLIR